MVICTEGRDDIADRYTVTVKMAVVVLPAASRAVTVSTLTPLWSAIDPLVQFVVPVAVPLPPRLFVQLT